VLDQGARGPGRLLDLRREHTLFERQAPAEYAANVLGPAHIGTREDAGVGGRGGRDEPVAGAVERGEERDQGVRVLQRCCGGGVGSGKLLQHAPLTALPRRRSRDGSVRTAILSPLWASGGEFSPG